MTRISKIKMNLSIEYFNGNHLKFRQKNGNVQEDRKPCSEEIPNIIA